MIILLNALTLSLYALALSVRESHDLRLYEKMFSSTSFLQLLHLPKEFVHSFSNSNDYSLFICNKPYYD